MSRMYPLERNALRALLISALPSPYVQSNNNGSDVDGSVGRVVRVVKRASCCTTVNRASLCQLSGELFALYSKKLRKGTVYQSNDD